jgi:hypothetical protein
MSDISVSSLNWTTAYDILLVPTCLPVGSSLPCKVWAIGSHSALLELASGTNITTHTTTQKNKNHNNSGSKCWDQLPHLCYTVCQGPFNASESQHSYIIASPRKKNHISVILLYDMASLVSSSVGAAPGTASAGTPDIPKISRDGSPLPGFEDGTLCHKIINFLTEN